MSSALGQARDESAATSAQGERGLVVSGRRVGHVLDPRTGEPVDRYGSVTVVAREALAADALATALLVMGPDEGALWAAEHGGPAVGFLEPSNTATKHVTLLANDAFSRRVLSARPSVTTGELSR